MKLKLDAQDDIKILTVTGELSSQHAAILKVGLRKMFQTGVSKFVLDLTSTGPTTPEALTSVATGARADAEKSGIRILVASTLASIADAPDARSAAAKFAEQGAPGAEQAQGAPRSGADGLLEEEAQLQAALRKLQRRKGALEQHLAKAGEQDVLGLKKEFSDLSREVARLDRLVTGLSLRRKEAAFLNSSERKRARVSEILSAVLEQEGVLPIK